MDTSHTVSNGNANSKSQTGYSSISFISGSYLSFQILIKSSDVATASYLAAFFGPLTKTLIEDLSNLYIMI